MIASTVILSCAFTLRNLAISAFYSLAAPALPPTSTLARRTKLPNVPSPIPSESAPSTHPPKQPSRSLRVELAAVGRRSNLPWFAAGRAGLRCPRS